LETVENDSRIFATRKIVLKNSLFRFMMIGFYFYVDKMKNKVFCCK